MLSVVQKTVAPDPPALEEIPARGTKAKGLGEILIRDHALDAGDLTKAQALLRRHDTTLDRILLAHKMVSPDTLKSAISARWSAGFVDLDDTPSDPRLMTHLDPVQCLKFGFIPWKSLGGLTVIVVSDPEKFHIVKGLIGDQFGPLVMALGEVNAIQRHIALLASDELSRRADARSPIAQSCRQWARPQSRLMILAVFIGLVSTFFVYPRLSIWIISAWVALTLITTSFLRLIALAMQVRARYRKAPPQSVTANVTQIAKLPTVSIIVPLFDEDRILPSLINRLEASDYPKELLEVCIVLEAKDTKTRNALAKIQMPPWMRVIEVPEARVQTKPRAMNYALDFCRGTIIGIYDAEDAPESDQIHRVVSHFRHAPSEVACVQGYLDFYNPKQNWLSRCFTIEYATWFRVVLHGIQKLGLPVPLGGTTVFFRREALEDVGAWDAHNVTEDADLGMRLARRGYRCEFVETTTFEEATCRPVPWVKQRSRWLKGFMMTWITHMRDPAGLYQDLGLKGFFAFHVLLLGAFSSFALAPVIWSLWWIAVGGTLPFYHLLHPVVWQAFGIGFVSSEVLIVTLGVFACAGPRHRFLIGWVPSLMFYWPLGSAAVYKAIIEVLFLPFYWDKTQHGESEKAPYSDPRYR